MKKLNLLWLVLPIILVSACNSNNYDGQMYENPADQAQIDQNAIVQYLIDNKVDAKRTESGIYYTVEREGDGNNPSPDGAVKVHYRGTLLDGTQFDSSYDRGEPIEFSLTEVIKGWTEGIPLFKEGGKGTLYIPSGLAYGPTPRPGGKIKPNDPLIFEVEVLEALNQEEYAAKMEKKMRDALSEYLDASKLKYEDRDKKIIEDYLKDNNIDAQVSEDGIYYIIEEPGAEKPSMMSSVTVHYKGTTLDGKQFDSSYDRGQPISFSLTRVVPGWTFGIPLFGKGGKGSLILPSYMGYGEKGAGEDIPPNSCLRFDIELIDFK